jgi:rhodanese-related sulfurtransferase
VKHQLPVSSLLVLSLASALVLGCKNDPSPNDGGTSTDLAADSAFGRDVATQDLRSENDALARDASPDIAADWLTAKDDLASSAPEPATVDSGRADSKADSPAVEAALAVDGLSAEAKIADASAEDSLGLDVGPSRAETGCTGWNSLVRLSPAELSDLMTKIDPIVINVHVPYEGDIPGTDTSIPYNNVDAIDTYLHQDHCADVVLICKSGGMSYSAGLDLIGRGYLRVRDLSGGFTAWKNAGYPLLKDGGI